MDSWFAKNKSDYSYFLFLCFRLRHFLLSYFYSKKRDKSGFIFSHFQIIRKFRTLFLKIYFYDATFEETRQLLFPKVMRFIRGNFDNFFFSSRVNNLDNFSLGSLIESDNLKRNHLWLRDFLKFKNVFKLTSEYKFSYKFFEKFIISYLNSNLNMKYKVKKKSFILYIYRLFLIFINSSKSINLYKNKFSMRNFVERWSSFLNTIPYQQIVDKSFKVRSSKYSSVYKNSLFSYFFSFNKYMSRFYMSNMFISSNWRLWKKVNKLDLINYSKANVQENIFNNKFKISNNKFSKFKLYSLSKVIFSLMFASYFGVFRFNTAYDWKYWFFLLKQLIKKDYDSILKYFSYRSLFTLTSYKSNMVILSSLMTFFINSQGNVSFKKLKFFISEFFRDLYLSIITGSYISVVWLCLNYKINYLVDNNIIIPQYYLISNESINSIFLSRYIAKMLDYNNTLRGTLSPLKREFFQVVRRASFNFNTSNLSIIKEKNIFFRRIFRYILIILFDLYKNFLNSFYKTEALFFTLDMFIIYIWIFNSNINNNINKLASSFISKRDMFICLFIYNLKISYSNNLYKWVFLGIANSINPIIKIQSLFRFIFIDSFTNKNILFNDFISVSSNFNTKSMRLALNHYNSFLNYQYAAFSYYSLLETTNKNIVNHVLLWNLFLIF